jgi:uncharacterized protein (DUF1330 family)
MLLTAILWANPGQEEPLVEYEDAVLALIPKHGGRVIERVRAEQPGDGPYEVQLIELPTDEALADYMQDPLWVELVETHRRAIARAEVLCGGSVL